MPHWLALQAILGKSFEPASLELTDFLDILKCLKLNCLKQSA